MSASQVLAYAVVAALAIATPGADFAVVFKHAAQGGRRGGLRAAAGVATGFAVHATAAGIGVGALLLASATAFTVVKILGAVYLVWLGGMALLGAYRGRYAADPDSAVTKVRRPYRDAVLINVLNPKVVLTYLALMPQFLPSHATVADTLVLSVVTVAIALTWFVAVALSVAAFRRVLLRERVRRAIDAVSGVVLVGLAVRLARSARA